MRRIEFCLDTEKNTVPASAIGNLCHKFTNDYEGSVYFFGIGSAFPIKIYEGYNSLFTYDHLTAFLWDEGPSNTGNPNLYRF